MKNNLTIGQMAQVAHGAHKAYKESIGEFTTPEWGDLSGEQKAEIIERVDHILKSYPITPKSVHDKWLEQKKAKGWQYREQEVQEGDKVKKVPATKNEVRKINPLLVPYGDLPLADQFKNELLVGVVSIFAEKPPPKGPKVKQEDKPKQEKK